MIADEVEGTMMVCHTVAVEFFRLNVTGAQIWEICDESTIDDIVKRLIEDYPGEDYDRLTEEVQRFISSLEEAGLVEVQEIPSPRFRLRVDVIEGIGVRTAQRLMNIGVNTVDELVAAHADEIARAIGVSEQRAGEFIAMAEILLRLSATVQRDEVAELIVIGGRIKSVEELASADPEDLYANVQDALASNCVRVPPEFSVTPEDVESWIRSAKEAIR